MKKSDFKMIKCKGCGKPFKARIECIPKQRPEECYYCKDCLSFHKATILQLDNFYKRLDAMEYEIDRLRKFHEEKMKQLYENDGV